jgi:hypothetical protein
MDALNLLNAIYKRELADAIEKKVMTEAQCEIYKQQVEQLKKELAELKESPKK